MIPRLLLALLLFFSGSSPIHAEIQELGSAYVPDDAYGVALDGDWLFVANGAFGLRVLDVSEPDTPLVVANFVTPGVARDVVVVGDVVLLSDGEEGIRAIDVSDPSAPVELSVLDTPGVAGELFRDGDILYVADASGGLRILDISEPTLPVEIADFEAPGKGPLEVLDVWVEPPLAYLAVSDASLRVVDVSNPAAPQEVGSLPREGEVLSVSGLGDTVYLGVTDRVEVISVADPSAPALQGNLDFTSRGVAPPDLVVASGDLYVFHQLRRRRTFLTRFDLSEPGAPVESGQGELRQEFVRFTNARIVVGEELAFVSVGEEGVRAFDVADPKSLEIVGTAAAPDDAWSLLPHGDHVFLGVTSKFDPSLFRISGIPSLRVVDVSDPSNPREVGRALDEALCGDLPALAIEGDLLFVADNRDFCVLDIADPTNPILLDSIGTNAGASWRIRIDGTRAYLLTHGVLAGGPFGFLECIDFEDPGDLVSCGFLDLGAVYATDFVFKDEVAYIFGFEVPVGAPFDSSMALWMVEFDDEKTPQLVDRFDGPEVPFPVGVPIGFPPVAVWVTLVGDLIYATPPLWVVDVSVPLAPEEVAASELVATDLAVRGESLLTVRGDREPKTLEALSILEVYDRSAVESEARASLEVRALQPPPVGPQPIRNIAFASDGELFFAADFEVGLRVFSLPEPATTAGVLAALLALAGLRSRRILRPERQDRV